VPKFLRCGARFAGYELERYGISRQPQRLGTRCSWTCWRRQT